MGFIAKLIIVYLILLIIDIFAFVRGLNMKKWFAFIFTTVIMILGVFILGYLWITSPM